MKISYISGLSPTQMDDGTPSNYDPNAYIGSLSWADRVGYKMSTKEKIAYRIKQTNPVASIGRGIMRELISGNRGGLASMLWGMSPFNTNGQIDNGLKNQFDAFVNQARREANNLYPLKRVTQGYVNALAKQNKVPAPQDPILGNLAFGQLPYAQDNNYKKHVDFLYKAKKEASKKFPYVIIPASNEASRKKYREIEIAWLKAGGNVDSFTAAVKEGYSKSPRNKTFNYLLGKFAARQYVPKDLGLAIRAVAGASLGGDRFKWTDKDIFNPWAKRFGSMKIGGTIGTDPASAAAAAATTSAPWWVALLKTITPLIIAALPFLFASRREDGFNQYNAQVLGEVPPTRELGPYHPSRIMEDPRRLILPGAIAAGAYILLSKDK
jgi:hypothetical protein